MPRFKAVEQDAIWTVFDGQMPIGRAVSKRDADCFVDAFNGLLGDDLRDRILAGVNDAIEEAFEG